MKSENSSIQLKNLTTMSFRRCLFGSFALYLCAFSFITAVERSVIPLMDRFEIAENLPVSKYTKAQYDEICSALSHKNEKIRIVSYNMLFTLYDHNLEECNRWPQRLPRIVELLADMQPDLIGVQELYKHQVDDLLPLIGHTYAFISKPCDDGELNGIFYRKERFEVLEQNVLYMSENPQRPASETLTLIKLKDKQTGRELTVSNTHLAFRNIEKRDFQARFIAEKLHPISKTMPVILTGDMNTFPNRLDLENLPFYDGDYILRLLTSSHFKKASEVSLLGHLGPLSTFTNAGDDDVSPFHGVGTPGVFLDHIYVSDGITVLLHAVQPGTVDGHFPSDHMPVVTDFVISSEPAGQIELPEVTMLSK